MVQKKWEAYEPFLQRTSRCYEMSEKEEKGEVSKEQGKRILDSFSKREMILWRKMSSECYLKRGMEVFETKCSRGKSGGNLCTGLGIGVY